MSYNVFDDDLDVLREEQHPGYVVGGTALGAHLPMTDLGATLYVLPPGNAQAPYHWHHAAEELLVILAGTPTLRSRDGEHRLRAGDVVSFPRGPAGAHKLLNGSSESVRYLIVSTKPEIEVVEYPDTGNVGLGSSGQSWRILDEAATRGYWDGE